MEIPNGVSEFAAKPSGIIYVGIVALLLISEWKNPTNLWGIIEKIIILIVAFVVVAVFVNEYFGKRGRKK